jgi:HEAT repeat protein
LALRLAGSGPEEVAGPIARLLELGEPALDVLARAFPGSLWPTPHVIPGTEFRTRSAVAAALVAFDEAAWPHVEWLMQAPTVRVRAQACELAAALPRPELMEALATAALDLDAEVRDAALAALAGVPQAELRRLALGSLLEHLMPRFDPKLRRRALDALVSHRDGASASALVELLGDENRSLAHRAHVGLRLITGHDFGNLRDGWSRWLATHGARSRADWLKSGLQDRREDLAELAHAELAALETE